MPEFTFTIDQDGTERTFSLQLPDEQTAKLYAGRTLDLLLSVGAMRIGYIAVGEGCGDAVEWLGSWNANEGDPVTWQDED